MKKLLFGLYALLAYAIGLGSLLYLMGFLANWQVPVSIDSGTPGEPITSLVVNVVVLVVWFSTHSIMARPAFKRRWARLIPPALERSTYVLISGLTLFGLVALWQPLPAVLWRVEAPGLVYGIHALYLTGWGLMVLATFQIDHLAFFGLDPVWRYIRRLATKQVPFSARYLYGVVRHPISLGWLIVFWATPHMTGGHLLMAVMASGYIFLVTPIEEADLVEAIGEPYREYQGRVRPFLPLPRKPPAAVSAEAAGTGKAPS